ncbi:MAG: sodium:proton antiporter [Granulicella sp.]
MSVSSLIALLLSITGLFAYLNHRFLRLPLSVGVMAIAVAFSLLAIVAEHLGLPLRGVASGAVAHVNFSEAFLDGMLSFMLFAGVLHVDLAELREQKMLVAVLATVGVVISTAVVGLSTWFVFRSLGLVVPFLACLTFGALISPTDPIAVMGLLKQVNAPKSLSTKIAGESLFNDGIGIVVFLLVLRMWTSGSDTIHWQHTFLMLLGEVGGGIGLGLLLGAICFFLLRSIDNYQVELMLTLALVSGGYQLASTLHASGPLTIVTAGLLIGTYGRKKAMSSTTRKNLDLFWETLDELLSGILFVLIGLEVLLLPFEKGYLIAAICAIPLVLASRFVSLVVPLGAFKIFKQGETPISILTWGGLRGGISIALALSLPTGHVREVIVLSTYAAVAFSILVQATTMPHLLRRILGNPAPESLPS